MAEWRRATGHERQMIYSALNDRKNTEQEFRDQVTPPLEALLSIEGVARWVLGVMKQDNPAYMVLGGICLLWLLGAGALGVWNLANRLLQ